MSPAPNRLAMLISLIGVGLSQPVRAMIAPGVLLDRINPAASSLSAGAESGAGNLLVPGRALRTSSRLQLALPAALPDGEAGSPPTPPGSPWPPGKAPAGGKHLFGTADPAKRSGAGPPRLALVDADPPDDLKTADDPTAGPDGVPGEHGPGDEPGAVLTSVTAIEPLPDSDAVMRTLAALLMAEPPDDGAAAHAPAPAAEAHGEHARPLSTLAETVAPGGSGPGPADTEMRSDRAAPPSPTERAACAPASAGDMAWDLDCTIAELPPAAMDPHRGMGGLSRLITEIDLWGYPDQPVWRETDGQGDVMAARTAVPARSLPSGPPRAARSDAPSSGARAPVAARAPSPRLAQGLQLPAAADPTPALSESEKVLSTLEAVLSPGWTGPSHARPAAGSAQPAVPGTQAGEHPPGAMPGSQSSKVLSTLAEVLSPGWAGPSHARPVPEATMRTAGGREQAAASAPRAAPGPQPGPFGHSAVAVREDALDDVRGGFTTADGLKISFGIERAVYVNGSLVATTSLNMSELGTISGGHEAGAGLPPSAMAIIQNGTGNAFQTGPVSAGSLGTVIQNTLNDQKIESITVINATVNSLGILKSMDTQSALRGAIIDALRR